MRLLKEMLVLAVGAVALIYLLNPTAGFLEFIPDNLPFIGNLDEAGATALLLAVLGYYGIDMTRLFGSRGAKQPPAQDS
jgi:hypothetical protein